MHFFSWKNTEASKWNICKFDDSWWHLISHSWFSMLKFEMITRISKLLFYRSHLFETWTKFMLRMNFNSLLLSHAIEYFETKTENIYLIKGLFNIEYENLILNYLFIDTSTSSIAADISNNFCHCSIPNVIPFLPGNSSSPFG